MGESRRDQIIAGVGVSQRKRRAYIDRWLAAGTLESDPDAREAPGSSLLYAVHQMVVQTVTKQAGKVIHISVAALKHVRDGMNECTEAEREARLTTCAACPLFEPAAMTCGDCGCNLKIKARWRTSECPRGRWSK